MQTLSNGPLWVLGEDSMAEKAVRVSKAHQIRVRRNTGTECRLRPGSGISLRQGRNNARGLFIQNLRVTSHVKTSMHTLPSDLPSDLELSPPVSMLCTAASAPSIIPSNTGVPPSFNSATSRKRSVAASHVRARSSTGLSGLGSVVSAFVRHSENCSLVLWWNEGKGGRGFR